jgi:Nitrous oxide-stimulated promoter
MNATDAIIPTNPRKFANRRLAREWKTVSAMLHIYCRDKHGGNLCTECQALLNYVNLRLDRCRFGEAKPTCARCPVHCYQRDRREQIRLVMRYSGPKMILEHPILSLWHLLDGWLKPAPSRIPFGREMM